MMLLQNTLSTKMSNKFHTITFNIKAYTEDKEERKTQKQIHHKQKPKSFHDHHLKAFE